MTRHVKGSKNLIRIFPDKPITKKPLEVRQGKGKGNVEYWVCPIKPGRILYEMEGVDESIARENFNFSCKLPVGTKICPKEIGLMAKKKANLSEIEKLNMEYLDLKLKNSSGSLKETHKLSELRKDIARLKTKERMGTENE